MRRGFTLLEFIIVLGISSLLMLVLGALAVSIFRTSRSLNASLTANEQARRVIIKFVQELRTALPSSVGAYPLAEAKADTITFYSNVDDDTAIERVRYFMDGTTLKRGLLKPTGQPLVYNPANETIEAVATDIINSSDIFSYYDTNHDGQSAALTIPPNLTAVRLVRIQLSIDTVPNEPPDPYTISSKVNLRNLKDNL